MSDDHHHHHHYASGSSPNSKKYGDEQRDEFDNQRLWCDFETCAQMVSRLYRDPSWKGLQSAAASTTQLYKSGMDGHRRGYEAGLIAGRAALAKEVLNALGKASSMSDLNLLVQVLYNYIGIANAEAKGNRVATTVTGETLEAVHLFQQALAAPQTTSQARPHELNSFLSSQVQRHRKRQRSPSSPSSLIKKLKRS